jgi:hypothetical protein
MKRKFSVTLEDIELANGLIDGTNRPFTCPVAQCLVRELSPKLVNVGYYDVNIVTDTGFVHPRFMLPADATAKILRYDDTGNMDPFDFELTID